MIHHDKLQSIASAPVGQLIYVEAAIEGQVRKRLAVLGEDGVFTGHHDQKPLSWAPTDWAPYTDEPG